MQLDMTDSPTPRAYTDAYGKAYVLLPMQVLLSIRLNCISNFARIRFVSWDFNNTFSADINPPFNNDVEPELSLQPTRLNRKFTKCFADHKILNCRSVN